MARRGLEVLEALDRAKTQWYHFTAIVVAGMGFFTDAYDLFCISTVTRLLGRIYFYDASSAAPGALPTAASSLVSGVALVGTLLGQLLFGWLGDRLGRKRVYGITLFLMLGASLASGLSFGSSGTAVVSTVCFFRFWLGLGIGGDYPLSATIMAEYANTRTRGAFIAAVFAMQGLGILAGAAAALLVSAAFDAAFPSPSFAADPLASTAPQADYVWRIILMAGALPAALTYYWRAKLPETARYTALVEGRAQQAAEDMAKLLQQENGRTKAEESVAVARARSSSRATMLQQEEAAEESENTAKLLQHENGRTKPEESVAIARARSSSMATMLQQEEAAEKFDARASLHADRLDETEHLLQGTRQDEQAQGSQGPQSDARAGAHHHVQVPQPDAIAGPRKTSGYGLISAEFVRKHGKHLLGTASCWFFVDIAFYSSNLFQRDVLSAIGWLPEASTMNAIEEVYQIARSQALIALCSTVPGYWATVLTIDLLGRFAIQLQGFFFMTAFMLAIAIPYSYWQTQAPPIAFVALYACTFFFANFGPNSTTFILPAEIFPARLRSTCHGISAGAGRLGAIVGAFGFQPAWDSQAIGHSRTLIALAACSAAGLLCTFLVPETKGRSLEEIAEEDDYHLIDSHNANDVTVTTSL